MEQVHLINKQTSEHYNCDVYQCQFWCCCFPLALYQFFGFSYGCCPPKEFCCNCKNVDS
jgi:hypothetical protein